MAHLDERVTDGLHRSHDRTIAHALCPCGDVFGAFDGQLHEFGCHLGEKRLTQVTHELVAERARVATLLHREGNGRECAGRVTVDDRFDELVEIDGLLCDAACRNDEFECGQRVARASPALNENLLNRRIGDFETRVGNDEAHVLGQVVHRQQVELQVLGAAADGLADLLRVGGGENEDDVRRRLFQGLQQRRFGGLRQHVDFVEDEHAVATGAAQTRPVDEVTYGFDAVVAGCVEFDDVVAGAGLDGETRRARAARFSVDG